MATRVPPARPLTKLVVFFGHQVKVACDGRCSKAWGSNSRPKVRLGSNPDDYYWVPDSELGDAPSDPGTYEGDHAKPIDARSSDDINKWCVRECERMSMSDRGKAAEPLVLRDFSTAFYNYGDKRNNPDALGCPACALGLPRGTSHTLSGGCGYRPLKLV